MAEELKHLLEIKYKRLELVKNAYTELMKLNDVQNYITYIKEYNKLVAEIRELENI